MSSTVSYVNTRTRMMLVRSAIHMTIQHTNREEEVEPGMMFGFDVSKIGTPDPLQPLLMGNGAPLWRRIGTEAFRDCEWVEDATIGDMQTVCGTLLSSVSDCMNKCTNESYRAAWEHFRSQVVDTGEHVAVYYQRCGIKVIVAVVDTVAPHQRAEYPRLLAECNGKPTVGVPSFDTSHTRRYIVCEPLLRGGAGGFPMNVHGMRDADGTYRGTSVYQKPENQVDVDWMRLTNEEAERILHDNGRVLPWHQIRVLQQKIAAISSVA